MKARGQRFQSADLHHEDWVEGSWTVDCVCGVTFDDGEEMVNCDECGVWVHTRCSRYIKGEDLFTCYRCKAKNNRHDSEENEVAKLLVELPTKTVRMDTTYTTDVPSRRSFRLWRDLPMEQRVHSHGKSGGDPALFKGICSVFSPQLWKATGYVPKTFNFKYREFPCWDEEDAGIKNEQENENNGAGVLFSLSKPTVTASPVSSLDGRKWESTEGAWDNRGLERDTQKVSTCIGPGVIRTVNQQNENFWTAKDGRDSIIGGNVEQEADANKKSEHSSKAVITPATDAKHMEFCEARSPTSTEKRANNVASKEDNHLAGEDNFEQPKTKLGECETVYRSSSLIDHSSTVDDAASSLLEIGDVRHVPVKPQVDRVMIRNVHATMDGLNGCDMKPCIDDGVLDPKGLKEKQVRQISNRGMCVSSLKLHAKEKRDYDDDTEKAEFACDSMSNKTEENIPRVIGSESNARKILDTDRKSVPVNDRQTDGEDGSPEYPFRVKRELGNSLAFKAEQNCPSETEQVSGCAGELSPTAVAHRSPSENSRLGNANSSSSIGKRLTNDDIRRDISRQSEKDHSKSSFISAARAPHLSKSSHVPVPKQTETKGIVAQSSMTSTMHASVAFSGSGENGGSPQHHSAIHGSSKMSVSGSSPRGEKCHSNSQPLSKVSHAPPTHPTVPSNSAAGLSDEELALLLHQELNSSPRVPRVPRIRNAGSLPQLSPPSAVSMLIKRASVSGVKDQNSVSRRKCKDRLRDEIIQSHDLDDNISDTHPSSPEKRKYKAYPTASSTKREDNGSQAVRPGKSHVPFSSTATASSGLSSSAEANDYQQSSIHNSSWNLSDEDLFPNKGTVHRTLPDLINEIMSKGRRMTCEELCNAVLPHWKNLRKHNGERYAYTTPSQGVLDCLRTRHTWAELIDRGPKTKSTRKTRKVRAEDSDDNEYEKGQSAKEADSRCFGSQREEFPKGKRNVRKRRQLALHGNGMKDSRKRRKLDLASDDDDDEDDDVGLSNSAEESNFSEDEVQGGDDCLVASTSSDERTE